MASLTTKKGVLRLLFDEQVAAESAIQKVVSKAARKLGDDTNAEALLKSVLGRQRVLSEQDLAKSLQVGALPAPRISSSGKGASKATPGNVAVAPGPLPKALRNQIGEIVADVTKSGRFDALLESLGWPTTDEWAVLLRRAATLGFKTEKSLEGQIATVTGWLLERIRKSTHAFRSWAPNKAQEIMHAYNKYKELTGKAAFKGPFWAENVLDGNGKLLSDGMHIARSEDGRWLVVMIDEVKLESVAGDVRAQFEDVIGRIRSRGLVLNGFNVDGLILNNVKIPPELIDLPVASTRQAWGTELVAYLENAKPRTLLTPAGFNVVVVGTESHDARAFVKSFLADWRKLKTPGNE